MIEIDLGCVRRPRLDWDVDAEAPRCVTEALCWSYARPKLSMFAYIAASARLGKATMPISPIAWRPSGTTICCSTSRGHQWLGCRLTPRRQDREVCAARRRSGSMDARASAPCRVHNFDRRRGANGGGYSCSLVRGMPFIARQRSTSSSMHPREHDVATQMFAVGDHTVLRLLWRELHDRRADRFVEQFTCREGLTRLDRF